MCKPPAMGPQGVIPATAVAGAAAVDLRNVTGSIPGLMVQAVVQADYAARLAVGNR
jgi:hypothetical protein